MTVRVEMTNGFGNNLFQYTVGRLIAEATKKQLVCDFMPQDKYGAKTFEDLGLPTHIEGKDGSGTYEDVNDSSIQLVEHFQTPHPLVKVKGHFEDYNIFPTYLEQIREWYRPVEPIDNCLVLHLRLGDRLVYKTSYHEGMCIHPSKWISTIVENYDFAKLHIVTDLPEWRQYTIEDIEAMEFHTPVGAGERVTPTFTCDYLNTLVDELSYAFDPIVQCSGYLNVAQDFDYLRRFKQIIFQHGTLAWWAAAVASPDKVGVYGPWRPSKGSRNKNLGQTNYPGWFSWK